VVVSKKIITIDEHRLGNANVQTMRLPQSCRAPEKAWHNDFSITRHTHDWHPRFEPTAFEKPSLSIFAPRGFFAFEAHVA
jgi:hypothetical protein